MSFSSLPIEYCWDRFYPIFRTLVRFVALLPPVTNTKRLSTKMTPPFGKQSIITGGNEEIVLKHLVWKESCRIRFQRDVQAARHLEEMATSMIEYRDDATSVLSLVPLWNPSDDDCWRESHGTWSRRTGNVLENAPSKCCQAGD